MRPWAAAAGIWSAGTNQSGRDTPSSPAAVVRSTGSLSVQSGAVPSSWIMRRSMTWPATWRNAIWSPAGDHVGAQLLPSSVSRWTSAPVVALRITTSVPYALVRVAAM